MTADTDECDEVTYVKKWVKTRKAIVFRFSHKVIQMVFTDKTEICLSSEHNSILFLNKQNERTEMPLGSALDSPDKCLKKRLKYAKEILDLMTRAK